MIDLDGSSQGTAFIARMLINMIFMPVVLLWYLVLVFK